MKHALRRCDEEGIPAYLESSNPRNISLYEPLGFNIIGKIQCDSSPVMTPMLRPPNSRLRYYRAREALAAMLRAANLAVIGERQILPDGPKDGH